MKINYSILNSTVFTFLLLFTITFNARAGSNDNALNFSSSVNNYVLVSNPGGFNVDAATDFTFQAVVKTTNSTSALFSKMTNSAYAGYQVWVHNDKLMLEWANDGVAAQNVWSNTSINDGECHHVAVVVVRGTNTVKMYIDGLLDYEVTNIRYGANIDNAAPVYIGRERTGNGNLRYVGDIDEVAFFKVARTAEEILQSSTNQLIGDETGIEGCWKMNVGTPSGTNTGLTTAPDNSGNSHDGTLFWFTLTGGTSNWISSPCPLIAPPLPIPINNWALYFSIFLILAFALTRFRKIA